MPPWNSFTRTCLAVSLGQASSMPGQAATITVNSALDDRGRDQCTLGEAIDNA